MSVCTHCGKELKGDERIMTTHIRYHCPALKKTAKNNSMAKSPDDGFDPVAIIESLDADRISLEIGEVDKRRKALVALLAVAEANSPKTEKIPSEAA